MRKKIMTMGCLVASLAGAAGDAFLWNADMPVNLRKTPNAGVTPYEEGRADMAWAIACATGGIEPDANDGDVAFCLEIDPIQPFNREARMFDLVNGDVCHGLECTIFQLLKKHCG